MALVVAPAPVVASAGGDAADCGAISVEERPPLGDRTNDFDWTPYQRAHDDYLQHYPDVFASGYIAGKHLYVGFTRRGCHHLREIRQMVDQGWRFRAFIADHSWRDLRNAQRCVGEIAHRDDLDISAWGPDVWRNKLWVMLRQRTERRERVIRSHCPEVAIFFTEGTVEPL